MDTIGPKLVMHLAVAVGQYRLVLHPGEVTLALVRRHGLTHVIKMLEHLFLTLGTKLCGFSECFFDFTAHGVGGCEQMLQVLVFFVNAAATFYATGHVGIVHLGDALEFGVAQMKLCFQPGQLRRFVALDHAAGARAGIIERTIGHNRARQTRDQNQKCSFHFEIQTKACVGLMVLGPIGIEHLHVTSAKLVGKAGGIGARVHITGE